MKDNAWRHDSCACPVPECALCDENGASTTGSVRTVARHLAWWTVRLTIGRHTGVATPARQLVGMPLRCELHARGLCRVWAAHAPT